MIVTFNRSPVGSPACTRRTILMSWSGRFRGARRITEMRFTVDGSWATGSTFQAAFSMPLGSTITGRSGPAIRRIGSAATSLTADNTTGQRDQRPSRSSPAKAGVA